MPRSAIRALGLAAAGALAAVAALAFAYDRQSGLTLDMDRDLPRIVTGLYDPERVGSQTYAWTGDRVELSLPGADRRGPWRCVVRLKSGHPAGTPQPAIRFFVDGAAVSLAPAPDDYHDIEVNAPPRPSRPGLTLGMTIAPTFVPSASDTRSLGVQIDRLSCGPAGFGALPPSHAITAAAVAGAAFGAALGFVVSSAGLGAALMIFVSAAQAYPISLGPAPYSTAYLDRVALAALWIAAFIVVVFVVLQDVRRQVPPAAARIALAASATGVYLKLAALLHPAKAAVDAVFHAHRLESVLGGGFYFSQVMPDGVRFPYAIGLYLSAAPFVVLTRDHVALLRVVCAAAEGLAGLLLYPLVVRAWGDRRVGVLAVLLFIVAPMGYVVAGNANLTNDFGQSVALMAVAAAASWTLGPRKLLQLLALTSITTLALLCHVSTFGLLTATLASLAALCAWRGRPALVPTARWIALSTGVAIVVSVVFYYGRPEFHEVYRSLGRVADNQPAIAAPDVAGARTQSSAAPAAGTGLLSRALMGLDLSARGFGWPTCLLALIGIVRVWSAGIRDRLSCAVAAWGIAYAAFFALGVLTPVKPGFERYALEFVARVTFAVIPAAAILAARGGVWAWQRGAAWRIGCAAALLWAFAVAVEQWIGWIR